MSGEQPWDFGTAHEKGQTSSVRQEAGEEAVRTAYKELAEKRRAYYTARAKKILELRAGGMAITACETVAKGDPVVVNLGYAYKVAEGIVEAAKSAGWRLNKDRALVEEFVNWSKRRELAEFHGRDPEEPTYEAPIGRGDS